MRFDFFETLSRVEAEAFLRRFLETESLQIKNTAKQGVTEGIRMDYSIKSIAPFMRWILTKLVAVPEKPDSAVPEWLQNCESYTKHLFDFDDRSKRLILQAGYYLGESFVNSYSSLRWGIGNQETAVGNMPVVEGFQKSREMAPILIAENLLGRIVAEPQKAGDIEIAVERWSQKV
jgi:hypothetical protein